MTCRKAAAIAVAFAVSLACTILWQAPQSDSAAASTPVDYVMLGWVNNEREWAGVPAVVIDGDLTAQAQLQAGRMSACGCLFHTPSGEFSWWLNRGWWRLSENVGGTSGAGIEGLYSIHLAFIASPGHKANMLDPNVDAVGIAVRQSSDGRQWVAEFFGGV